MEAAVHLEPESKRSLSTSSTATGTPQYTYYGLDNSPYKKVLAANANIVATLSAYKSSFTHQGNTWDTALTCFRPDNKRCMLNVPSCSGCSDIHSVPKHLKREHHEAFFWKEMVSIYSPDAVWQQLRSAYFISYFSTGAVDESRFRSSTQGWSSTGSPVMAASRDALCLVHLGVRYCDERLLDEGRLRHATALKLLREDLSCSKLDDSVLAAAFNIANTSMYRLISHDPGEDHLRHVRGLESILQARGAASIRSPFAKNLFRNIRHSALVDGLLRRKGLFLDGRSWIKAAGQTTDTGIELTNIALCIPRALERADHVANLKTRVETDVVDLLTTLTKLETEIQDWLLKYYARGNETPHRRLDISSFTLFQELCGELADVFDKVIVFRTKLGATVHVYAWICQLKIREAILDVSRLHPYPLLRARSQEHTLIGQVNEVANNLCQVVPFLASGTGTSGILATSGPLYFAAEWYERQNELQKLAWCRHARDFLQQDALLGGGFQLSVDLSRPIFPWWMLPGPGTWWITPKTQKADFDDTHNGQEPLNDRVLEIG